MRGPGTDSNGSNLLSVWDRVHGTLRLDVPVAEAAAAGNPGREAP